MYRVVVPMITAAAFAETIKAQAGAGIESRTLRTFYAGEVVSGVVQADIDRLMADGFLEAVQQPTPVEA